MNTMKSELKSFFIAVPLAVSLILAIIAFLTDAWWSDTYNAITRSGGYIWGSKNSPWGRMFCAALLIIAIIATFVNLTIFLIMTCVCKETPTFMYVCHITISILTSAAYLTVLIIVRIGTYGSDETSLGYSYYSLFVAVIFTIGAFVASVFLLVKRKNEKQAPPSEMSYQSPDQQSI